MTKKQTSKSFIVGCASSELTKQEFEFFQKEKPWGFILFVRNIVSPPQLKKLCKDLRQAVENESAPILIDQEGGAVQRLGPPHWQKYPSAKFLASLQNNEQAVWLMSRLHAFDLSELGITINCLPLLDIAFPQTHSIIGERAYGDDIELVTKLGLSACEGLKAGGVLPVLKHIPGHGRADKDSHKSLPVVSESVETLLASDFVPFQKLNRQPIAMTAHILYESIDDRVATFSKKIIGDIIRQKIGFANLLISDDISMGALSGNYGERARLAFSAGCDIVLHCNGNMVEMREIAANTPILSGKSLQRAQSALAESLCFIDKSDRKEIKNEFDSLIKMQ